ncbi:MAG: AAA family ATPase [bacterium]
MPTAYNTYYGFSSDPFGLNPDPRFFFKDKIHTDAMKYLVYGIQEREGIIEITGEVGTGKTLLCLSLIKNLDAETKCILILTPPSTEMELYEDILEGLSIPHEGKSRKEMIQNITDVADSLCEAGHSLVIVLDEAQHFSIDLLEKIRLLYNITADKRSLQIVLVGQPELEDKLKSKALRQLDQRITLRYRKLSALDKATTIDYINFRMELAGSYHTVEFNGGAYNEIYKFSQGVPRLINIACDKALLAGYLAKTNKITGSLIKVTLKSTQARWDEKGDEIHKYRTGRNYLVAASALAILVTGVYLGHKYTHFTYYKKTTETIPQPPVNQVNNYRAKPEVRIKEKSAKKVDKPESSPVVESSNQQSSRVGEQIIAKSLNKKEPDNEKTTKRYFHTSNVISKPISLEIQSRFEVPADLNDYNAACMIILLKSMGYQYLSHKLVRNWERERPQLFNYSAAAKRLRLRACYLRTSIDELERFNLPCILVNYFDPSLNEDTSLVMVGLSSSEIRVNHPVRGMINIDREEFLKGWTGRAVAFWKNVDNLPDRLIYPWLENRVIIKKLGNRLKEQGEFRGASGSDYLISLIEVLKKYQKSHGLKPDGIIGPKTRLLLYSNLKDNTIPTLNSL